MSTEAEVVAQITAIGDKIKALKLEKAEKDVITEQVQHLLSAKKAFKDLTGKDYIAPGSDQAKPAKKKQPQGPSKKELRKIERERQEAEAKAKKLAAAEAKKLEDLQNDYSKERYGVDPMHQSHTKTNISYVSLKDISDEHVGKVINIRARIHKTRDSGKQCFMVVRERFNTMQTIANVNDTISSAMVSFCGSISRESLVRIEGTVGKAPSPISSCSVTDYELTVSKIFIVSKAGPTPFTIEGASVGESELQKEDSQYARILQDTRLDNRVIDLRTPANQAIFAIQSAICGLFREFLATQGFQEIHSPKIISAASEGGANVFTVDYFKDKAFLAQSPQLYKQMCICSDMQRVFEVAPVFRAEDSNTHRHLTEFVGLDLEMEIVDHYHEVLDMLDKLFVFIFKGLKNRYSNYLEIVSAQYPFEEFKFNEPSLRLDYREGVRMLREDGDAIGDYDDISTTQEKHLGKLVKEKYGVDFYMLDKYPLAVRPFYTMPCPHDDKYSNSYDLHMRGEEILSGAQRIHDTEYLMERAKLHEIDTSTIQAYLDAFKYGCPPHGGGGIGMERVCMLYMGLGNIRKSSLFPRDPKRVAP